jgi:hypothetical protein
MVVSIPFWYAYHTSGTIPYRYHWYTCTYSSTIVHTMVRPTIRLREAMQALVRVQAHMLARIVSIPVL